jgi:hypothetical protein
VKTWFQSLRFKFDLYRYCENMKRGGEINPMIPGKKVVAIFGFCDIRQFTDTTEVGRLYKC